MLCLQRKGKLEHPFSVRILEMLPGTLEISQIYFNIQQCGYIYIVIEIYLLKAN